MYREIITVGLLIICCYKCTGEGRNIGGEGKLFPDIINLASSASVSANATCGQRGQEFYCKYTDVPNVRPGTNGEECGVCDSLSSDPSRRHPPTNIIDGTKSWWQSPTLAQGPQYEWVTIVVDLHQVFEVAYVILKSGISPRPGNWILERSVDNMVYTPWQFYATSDYECSNFYNLIEKNVRGFSTEPSCTSFFSKIRPLEGGEIHTSLSNETPGIEEFSKRSEEQFAPARFIRFRFQKMQTKPSTQNKDSLSRHFYSVEDVTIGGRCMCNGHAESCSIVNRQQRCSCAHNTCGSNCQECCPMFHQFPWTELAPCQPCQCHNHADVCRYDPEVHERKLSLSVRGRFEGGGVCLNCRDFTTGINCETCQPGFFRPAGVPAEDPNPCIKCSCRGVGTTGSCIADDSQANLGRVPGACICKQGFKGNLCNECAEGYLDFPSCNPCPCSRAGSKNKACKGDCICKQNVMGPRCDTCVPGTFHLDEFYDLGCTACFCHGVTDACEAAQLAVYTISEKEHWKVSDLLQRRVIAATHSKSSVSVAKEDMSAYKSYFFVAPQKYLGKKLTSYGQWLSVKVSWVKLRGDISGGPTRCPDVIIEGGRYKISYGGDYYTNNTINFQVPLYEQGWYHFPKDLGDVPFHMPLEEYKLRPVTREEMMEVLSEIKLFMIRARFHSEQVESTLHDAILEYGKEGAAKTEATLVTGAVEKCFCPPGYTGLSCEICAPGYRRVDNIVSGGKCVACECNGHVLSCDPFTGACGECLHNTVGENCELCAPGYYGDATQGTPDDCKPCECPLAIGENPFIPECVADPSTGSFKCICPRGYDGPRCEFCADGYFGNPMVPNQPCRPCDCNGNVDLLARDNCDRMTGRCLKCLGNTAGFNCERCKENHYGDPKRGQCFSCECSEIGSLSLSCDPETGQCPCKALFTGKQCDRCMAGRGDIHAGCPPCGCDLRGSLTDICDPITGLCPCKPGVGGRYCDQCLENHYGDIGSGCSECNCDEIGSLELACDSLSGQCKCKPNVIGRTCDRCKPGYWGLRSIGECRKCLCSSSGTAEAKCDPMTGKCLCLPGVGGPECDRCLPGFWGLSPSGCKPCEPCDFPGKNCDLNTGRCVCPPNTEGDKCERCSQGFWDYSADIGCKACQCSGPGSLERQCDPRTGRCVCRDGFEGELCDRCSYGYYGYPNCARCNCNAAGTDPRGCRAEGSCQCDQDGQCPCKANVRGITCDRCAVGTFGLSAQNPLGCFECHCLRRSTVCSQAPFTWTQLALPGERRVNMGNAETRMDIINGLYVIPQTKSDVITVGPSPPTRTPLYWQLPREFLRDKITSYNGYLRFKIETRSSAATFPERVMQTYPLVSIQGNWQLVFEYYPISFPEDGRFEVRLHEDFWRRKGYDRKVTREEMMVALQNLQYILIRATHSNDLTTASLSEVSLDVGVEGTPVSSRKAIGVELCVCPPGYEGTSCQNPAYGYFIYWTTNVNTTQVIIDLVGESRPCDCNGRADTCHPKTGVCIDCRENTAGDHCELCKSGFYGNPNEAPCRPCACPSRTQNFADTCRADPVSGYVCQCRQGYTGDKCERCAVGYYGNPLEPGGQCLPCNCDPNGSIGPGCDANGNCRCKPGIIGRDCSQCAPLHIVSENGCTSCEDGCVDVLVKDVEDMIYRVTSLDISSDVPSPWQPLNEIRNITDYLSRQLESYGSKVGSSQKMLLNFELDSVARILLRRVERFLEQSRNNVRPSVEVLKEATDLLESLRKLRLLLEESVSYLDNYAMGETPAISVPAALDEAMRILRRMRRRKFEIYRTRALKELARAKSLLERVKLMKQSGREVDNLSHRFEDVNRKISDLMRIIRTERRNTDEVKERNEIMRIKLKRLFSILDEIMRLHRYTDDRNFNASRTVQLAEQNIRKIDSNFNKIIISMDELQVQTTKLSEYEASLWHVNNEYRDSFVRKAEDHALELKAQAITIDRLFMETRNVAVGPLQAAEAYQRIVDALLSAEQAAGDASEAAAQAYKKAYPGDPRDSLIRRSKTSLRISKRLRSEANALLDRVKMLINALNKLKNDVLLTERMIEESKETIFIANNQLTSLNPDELSRNIDQTFTEAEQTDIAAGQTLALVENLYQNLTTMKSYTKQIFELDSSLFKDVGDTISEIGVKISKAERMSINLVRQSTRIEVRGGNLRDRIEALKRKIEQTRQHASSIRVSLTTDEYGVCTRKYRPHLQPSTTNRLNLGYAINSEHTDSQLFFVGSSNGSDFMSVDMFDRKIHFTWNSGGGTKTIVHPLPLETNTPQASDETKWYHISISRIGNVGELSVRPAFFKNNRKALFSQPVKGSSPAGFTSMDLNPWDFAYIGRRVTRDRSSTSSQHDFRGCLHYVTIDGEPMGLWNFTESIGCSACNEGYEIEVEQDDKTAFGFNGKGYFKGFNRIRRPKPIYSIVLSFKSLDEDALLFLAYNDRKEQHISIELKGGYVVLTASFDSKSKLIMKSDRKFNINQMIQIQADVQISSRGGARMAKLVIGDQSQLGTVRGGPDLDLFDDPFYFGGVDPEFNNGRIAEEVGLRSLLGCMGGLSVLEVGKNPHTDGHFYGIDNSCPEELLIDVGFNGRGYLEMPSRILRRDSNFGFSFKTNERDALLMISTFIGQPRRGGVPNPSDYYSVSIVDGHLDLRLFAGSERHQLISRERYDDGLFHSFLALKENRKVQLFVDDELVNSTRLDRGTSLIEAPEGGGLFFGGVPYDYNLGSAVGSSSPYTGCIQNVIINNTVQSFNNPIRFRSAFVGRCDEVPVIQDQNQMLRDEQSLKSFNQCQAPRYSLDIDSLSFGGESYADLTVNKSAFKSDFELTFEFRTFRSNGLLVSAFTEKRKHYGGVKFSSLTMELFEHRLQVVLGHNAKKNTISTQPLKELSTGAWKKVSIRRHHRSVSIFVDGELMKKARTSRRQSFGDRLFIGGLPEVISRIPYLPESTSFVGCMRNLRLNKSPVVIPRSTKKGRETLVKVGQCFTSVESAAYFPGDGYARIDSRLDFSGSFAIRVEFKTWENEGILLGIFDSAKNERFTLQLAGGKVSLMANGKNFASRNETRIISSRPVGLCDNLWHTVNVYFSKYSVTIQLDDQLEEDASVNASLWPQLDDEFFSLYVGGFHDSPSSSTVKRTFRGCMKKITINQITSEFIEMNNVLLDSCPT